MSIQPEHEYDSRATLSVGGKAYTYYSLDQASRFLGNLGHLPCCLRLMLESLLRHLDDRQIGIEDMRAIAAFQAMRKTSPDVPFTPYRLLMGDKEGLSVMEDITTLRDEITDNSRDPALVAIPCPLDIVIEAGGADAGMNIERHTFLKWSEKAFGNVRIIPPGKGHINQVNMDALSGIIQVIPAPASSDQDPIIVPDTVLGTDPYLSVVGSLGTLSWTIDTLEAEDIILGRTFSLPLPHVLGVKIGGKLRKKVNPTDIALGIAAALRQAGCQGKFVEFYGPGLDSLSVKDRTLIASFVVACGASSVLFPIDRATISHLILMGYDAQHLALVEAYAKAQGLWRDIDATGDKGPIYSAHAEISLDSIQPCVSPRPEDRPLPLGETNRFFEKLFPPDPTKKHAMAVVHHGDVVWADIGSCASAVHITEVVAAGIMARKAKELGLRLKPWVRGVLTNANSVVYNLLKQSSLAADFEAIGFTVLKDDDPSYAESAQKLKDQIPETIIKDSLAVCSVSTGPHPLGKPLHPLCKANHVASPPLVVAYALFGSILADITLQAIGTNKDGKPVFWKDLQPSAVEINDVLEAHPPEAVLRQYKSSLYEGSYIWQMISTGDLERFEWKASYLAVKKPSYTLDSRNKTGKIRNIEEARVIALFGPNVPAEAIAPLGRIEAGSPAAHYLTTIKGADPGPVSFDMFTGNHEVMVRGAFPPGKAANLLLAEHDRLSGLAFHEPTRATLSFFHTAQNYMNEHSATVIVAGENFGHGPHQEWAAKSLRLLGIHAVLAESFDPSFRLNLVRVGVLPLQLKAGVPLADLKIRGTEFLHFSGLSDIDKPPVEVMMTVEQRDSVDRFMLHCCLYTPEEITIYRSGSLWEAALRKRMGLAV